MEKHLTRRQFLKLSTIVATGFLSAATVPAQAAPSQETFEKPKPWENPKWTMPLRTAIDAFGQVVVHPGMAAANWVMEKIRTGFEIRRIYLRNPEPPIPIDSDSPMYDASFNPLSDGSFIYTVCRDFNGDKAYQVTKGRNFDGRITYFRFGVAGERSNITTHLTNNQKVLTATSNREGQTCLSTMLVEDITYAPFSNQEDQLTQKLYVERLVAGVAKNQLDDFITNRLSPVSKDKKKSNNFEIEDVYADLARYPVAMAVKSQLLSMKMHGQKTNEIDPTKFSDDQIERKAWEMAPQYNANMPMTADAPILLMDKTIAVKSIEYAGHDGLQKIMIVQSRPDSRDQKKTKLWFNQATIGENGYSFSVDTPGVFGFPINDALGIDGDFHLTTKGAQTAHLTYQADDGLIYDHTIFSDPHQSTLGDLVYRVDSKSFTAPGEELLGAFMFGQMNMVVTKKYDPASGKTVLNFRSDGVEESTSYKNVVESWTIPGEVKRIITSPEDKTFNLIGVDTDGKAYVSNYSIPGNQISVSLLTGGR